MLILESTPRNTAAAIACRFRIASEDILVITPSDHIIDEMQLYEEAIQEAIEKATNIS
jgi:mannose-1-phosphate guanylyltransferase